MTNGREAGTSGGARFWRWIDHPRFGPLLVVALVGVAVATVNASSVILEAQRDGRDIHPMEPIFWEFSSAVVIISLAPFIGWAVRRFPLRRENLASFLALHAALTTPFAAVHIAFIAVVRWAGYELVGWHYNLFNGGLVLTLLYEWRKDILVYTAIAAVYWSFQRRAERAPAESSKDERIEIRDGGAAVFLAPRDILFVEAAGNYVEFHTAGRTHLVRGTLAAWEARLAARGFVRVHRARLVNSVRIAAIKPTTSGDVEITLDDGRAVSGSRRYRAGLAAGAPSA